MRKLIFTQGEGVVLRDYLLEDIDICIRWQTQGEWRHYDAPWEGVHDSLTEEKETQLRDGFKKLAEDTPSHPRKLAVIATPDNFPIGFLTRYGKERFKDIAWVGINITDDAYLGRGIGTQALKLWVEYIFEHTTFYKIGLDTWSFNPRMMRVAEKVGFRYEGKERGLIEWKGERLDRVHFGMLRSEWEGKR